MVGEVVESPGEAPSLVSATATTATTATTAV